MCLVAGCVRLFLDRQEPNVVAFCNDFAQLRVSDEKTDSLESFLQLLATELEKDVIWQGIYLLITLLQFINAVLYVLAASQIQLEQARIAIEHTVMSRVYLQALYPNGDADIYRDQLVLFIVLLFRS